MKLQVALDFKNIPDALALMEIIHPYVDIAEAGTPLLAAEGARAVRALKDAYPDKLVLADNKIMDGGRSISTLAFEAGADIVSILGLATDATIAGGVEAAKKYGGAIASDTIQIDPALVPSRTRQLETLGVGYIAVHAPNDTKDIMAAPIDQLLELKANLSAGSACQAVISGGITPATIADVVAAGPDVIIVGGALCKADDPLAVAKALRAAMDA